MTTHDFDHFLDFAHAVGNDIRVIHDALRALSGGEWEPGPSSPPSLGSEIDALKALIYAGL